MTRALLVRPEAELDVAEAYSWYEQRAEGFGTEFVRAYEATLAGIERFPQAYPVVHRGVRRALLRRFPLASSTSSTIRSSTSWPASIRRAIQRGGNG